MTPVAEQIESWAGEFSRIRREEGWLQELRQSGLQRFGELGFPTTHDEEWRFTNVASVARTAFRVGAADLLLRVPEPVESISAEKAEAHLARYADLRNPFVALNTAFLNHEAPAIVLRVPPGTVVEQPIEITWEVADAAAQGAGPERLAVHPRTLILVGANAQCTIIETFKGSGEYLSNAVTEIVTADAAVVDHYKVQMESPAATHIATLQAQLGRSANFSSHSISLGGALVRNDAGAVLSEGSEATLNGLYVVNGTQHVDNHTVIDHAKPNGRSHELYKGILAGRSSAVFNGRIIVRKDAQKTDSKQTNKNLVLSDEAVIDTKPELQIHADDVRCTHGATIGQIDAESLFYLRSRGIGRKQARSLLTYAFAQDVIDRIKVQPLAESLERILYEKFYEHGE
jgi:Fe-S cluster assembly protein SufD